MGLLRPLPEVGWETTLNRNFLMAKDTLRTGDATSFKASRDALFASGIDWSRVLKLHLPPDLTGATNSFDPQDLHKLNKTFILNVQARIAAIRPQIEASIQSGKSQDELFSEIDNTIDTVKGNINNDMEQLRTDLKTTVQKLPTQAAQQTAVNVWLESWNTVQEAVGKIVAALGDIVNAIAKFFQQVWAWVQKAWNTVASAVSDAVDWIESLF